MDVDELLLYRGNDYVISEYIKIHQPTLDEIANYGELIYFDMVHAFTSVGADLKWQLNEIGIDYTTISDFELFYNFLIGSFKIEQTRILFGELDFSKFQLYKNTENDEMCLVQATINKFGEQDLIILDGYTYELIVNFLRKMHGFKRNNQRPANESTKQILIEDAKEEYMLNKDKERNSYLLNLISTMVNSSGFKYNHKNVWNMNIYAFLDSVKRISKIKNAELLLQSGYSGYGISFKDINNKQIDWLGELD